MDRFIPVDNNTNFKTGDILLVDSSILFIDHYAMVFYKDNVPYIIENKRIGGGIDIELLESYRKRRKILKYLRSDKTSSLTDAFIIDKSEQCKHLGYGIWDFNCEDFIKFVSGEDVGIDQRKKLSFAIIGIIVGGILGYLLGRKKKIGGILGALIVSISVFVIMIVTRTIRKTAF